MRENRTYGSEGGESKSLPYPYPVETPSLEKFPYAIPLPRKGEGTLQCTPLATCQECVGYFPGILSSMPLT